jgi:hypothetical protein
LPRAIAAWSFADAAATAALPAKCSSSAPPGTIFADDRRLATRFQDIVLCRASLAVLDNQSVWRLQSSLRVLFRVCGVWVTYRHGYFLRSMFCL